MFPNFQFMDRFGVSTNALQIAFERLNRRRHLGLAHRWLSS